MNDALPPTAENFPRRILGVRRAITECQARVARMEPWCQHRQDYVIEVWSPGCGEWQELWVCTPCCATLRGGGWQVRRASSVRAACGRSVEYPLT